MSQIVVDAEDVGQPTIGSPEDAFPNDGLPDLETPNPLPSTGAVNWPMRVVETRYGPMLVPMGQDVIGDFLQRYGEWGWLEVSFLAGVLDGNARVLDAGAFLGTFGLGLSLRCPGSFVCFVEANPVLREALQHNAGDRVAGGSAVLTAVIGADGSGVSTGHGEPGNLGATSYLCEGGWEDGPSASSVPGGEATTLQQLREVYGAFNLIKLDLEGMEAAALRGDADFLSTGQTTLWLECNEDRRSLHLARLLLDWELPVYYFAFPSFNPRNFNGDPTPVYPTAYEAGLLAAPQREPVLSEALRAAHCILKPIRSIHDLKMALWRTPRWGMAGWDEATKPELAALAGRVLRSETFETFLHEDRTGQNAAPAWSEASPKVVAELRALLETERAERAVIEAALREASALAIGRLDELAEERALRAAVDAGLREASALAIGRLSALAEETRRREAAEAELARTSARTLAHLVALGEVRDQAARAEAVAAQVPAWEREVERLRAREAELTGALQEANQARHAADERAGQANERSAIAEDRALRAEALAARLPEMERDIERMRVHEAGLAIAVEAARQTRQWAEDRARIAEERAAIAEQVVQVITASTVWRATAPLRGLVGQLPLLRSITRRGRRKAGDVMREPGP